MTQNERGSQRPSDSSEGHGISAVQSVRDRLFGGSGVRMGNDRVDPVPISKTAVHDILGSKRRSLILSYLVLDADGRATLSELAEYVAGVENGVDAPKELTRAQRERVIISLYQRHLPTLDEYGVIQYDNDRGVAEATVEAVELVKIDRSVSRIASGVTA